ncbi:hypothetical protein S40285_08517 [Stachybotrys chlorohalonatus IBT 40285]|uniref:Prefoldin subunit 1 n=1 Tax=Stachybotrys chlorohalonatus (strain IBT 40285) TaxID=1283841 RepID=A0A084Q7R1_STAC4|nr:hypothetical protein S40285_08517 [Stachybotrys chlorohalonata IBT 40285]
MAIPSQALQKLVREIETQAAVAEQQIGLVRSQVTTKQREQRLLRLTLGEMSSLSDHSRVYEGVGKMYVALPPASSEEPSRLHHIAILPTFD